MVVLPAVFLTRHLSLQICTLPCFVLKADHEVCILGVPSTRLSTGFGQQAVPVEGGRRGGEKEPPSPLMLHHHSSLPDPPFSHSSFLWGSHWALGAQCPRRDPWLGVVMASNTPVPWVPLSLICFLSPDHTPNIAFSLKALFKLSGVKFIFLLNSTDTVAVTWIVVVGIDKRKSL